MVGLRTTVKKKSKLTKVKNALGKRTTAMLEAAAKEGEKIAKDSIRQSPSGSGRFYHSPRTNRKQEASFPGKPPRQDSGDLLRGIKTRKINNSRYAIESNAPQSSALEFGEGTNLGGEPLDARPYMLPMALELKKKFGAIAKKQISEPELRRLIR